MVALASTATAARALPSSSHRLHCASRSSTESESRISSGTWPRYAHRQDATCTSAIARASSAVASRTVTATGGSVLGGTRVQQTEEVAVGEGLPGRLDDVLGDAHG